MDVKYKVLPRMIVKPRGSSKIGEGCTVGIAKPWQRVGDWLCPNMSCRNINFAFRKVCNLCGAAIPTGVDGGKSRTVTVRMTMDELEKWYKFKGMKQDDTKICEAAAISDGHCGNISASKESARNGTQWLIDSGASKHMVGSYQNFSDYAPDLKRQSVRLADGSTQAVMGTGTVMCGSNMPLSSVLHVPSFPLNLLSISCITKELNCAAIFYPTWCVFLELGTWKVLGTGIMRDGLYYLDDDTTPVAATVLSQSPLQEFLLHHRRLGHMAFNTLGQLYPHLYSNLQRESSM